MAKLPPVPSDDHVPEQITIDDEIDERVAHGQARVTQEKRSIIIPTVIGILIAVVGGGIVWGYNEVNAWMAEKNEARKEQRQPPRREGNVAEPELRDYSFGETQMLAAAKPTTATDVTPADNSDDVIYCPNGKLISENCGQTGWEEFMPDFMAKMDETKAEIKRDVEDLREGARIDPKPYEPPDTEIEYAQGFGDSNAQAVVPDGEVDHRDAFVVWAEQQARGTHETAVATLQNNREFLLSRTKPVALVHTSTANSLIGGIVLGQIYQRHAAADGVTNVLCGGDKLVGTYQRVKFQDTFRMGVVWTELERTDGYVVRFNGYGTDNYGQAGAGTLINRRLGEKYAAALAFTLVEDGLSAAIAASAGGTDNVAVGIGGDTESIAAIALKQAIDIPPVVTTRDHEQGFILLTQSLRLPEHECNASAAL